MASKENLTTNMLETTIYTKVQNVSERDQVGMWAGMQGKKLISFFKSLKICVKKRKKMYNSSQFFFAMYFKVFLCYFWKHTKANKRKTKMEDKKIQYTKVT